MNLPSVVEQTLDEQPHPFLFVTISGAHLYGFASADSDYDLRGCHVLPAREVLGMRKGAETIDSTRIRDGVELDVVSHDAEKFFGLLLKKNGYVLEQLFSPLVLRGGDDHERLKRIAAGCITKHHVHHYLGFARNQWQLFAKEERPRVKPLLYTYRVLLTGIRLMDTGRVEANLSKLNESFGLSFLDDLVQVKREGAEKEPLADPDLDFHRSETERLGRLLEEASRISELPENPSESAREELHELLIELRLRSTGES